MENEVPEEGLQQQTGEIAQSAREKMAAINRDFDGKVTEIGDRVKAARDRAKQFEPEANNIAGMTPEDARGMGHGLTIGYAVIGMPIGMYVIGLVVERFATPLPGGWTWSGGLAIIGGCLGIAFAAFASSKMHR